MDTALKRAREYELAAERRIPPEERPLFHLSARCGWMNDPNGFSYHQGAYHLFYQYHPYDSHWGPMHWGHAVSRDLLRWDYLPCALAPDTAYDGGGCFSGSALTLPDGRQLLMYTGVEKTDAPRKRQTQNLAVGDGLDYEKLPQNPVIGATLLPPGDSPFDFRDPRVLRQPDGSWLAYAACDRAGCGGAILRFRSEDLLRWRFDGTVLENRNRLGLMWECPDLFRLDGTDVLLISAQDMLPEGFEYHNGNGTVVFLGRLDAESGRFVPESDHALDYGIDFYAPQTVLTPDGRRVMIGWLQNWDTCNQHFRSLPWFGQMSLPRELFVQNGRLCQRPVRELEALRTETVRRRGVVLENGSVTLPGVEGRCLDLALTLDASACKKFNLHFAEDGQLRSSLSFHPEESVLKIDRKHSGSRRAVIHQRRARVRHDGGTIRLRLILDRYSAEVFVNDGEQVLSIAIDTPLFARGISFHAEGRAVFSLEAWRLDRPETSELSASAEK